MAYFLSSAPLILANLQVLTAHQSNRVCNALALLQCVASHPDTRSIFHLSTSLDFVFTWGSIMVVTEI